MKTITVSKDFIVHPRIRGIELHPQHHQEIALGDVRRDYIGTQSGVRFCSNVASASESDETRATDLQRVCFRFRFPDVCEMLRAQSNFQSDDGLPFRNPGAF